MPTSPKGRKAYQFNAVVSYLRVRASATAPTENT